MVNAGFRFIGLQGVKNRRKDYKFSFACYKPNSLAAVSKKALPLQTLPNKILT